jgi:hypothetical protein
MKNNSCVIIVGVPCSGEQLLGKALLAMGYTAEGTPTDESKEWTVLAINHRICDLPQKPKIDLSMAKYAHEAIDKYIQEKVQIGRPWIINDPMLCMTVSEYVPFLKKYSVDYKIIVTMRQLHHSALDMLRSDKSWKLEEAAGLIGRYAVARSLSIERLAISDKDNQDRIIYVAANDLIDKPKEEIESIVNLLKIDVSEENKQKAIAVLEPFAVSQK